jgi:AraC-like DNA-binding protein
MELIRETHPFPESFPFRLIYRHRMENRKSKYHYHDLMELIYVHDGAGTIFIDPLFYDMNAGDLFIIPGDVIHQTIHTGQTLSVVLFRSTLIKSAYIGENFDLLDIFRSRSHPEYKLSLSAEQRRPIEQFLADIRSELRGRSLGRHHAILAVLQRLLVEVARLDHADKPARPSPIAQGRTWMNDILSYIEDHLSEDLTLTHLASQALVSPAHFSRVFRQMTGFHLPEYLNIKRMMLAKELLIRTSLPIHIIAERCCFTSVSHFYKTFRKHFGYTPGDYRKQYTPPENEPPQPEQKPSPDQKPSPEQKA